MTNVANTPLARKLHAGLPVFLTALLGAACAIAQESPVSQGLAGSGIARIESPWLVRENPGALPFTDGGALVAAVVPPPIAIEGLARGSVAAALPVDPAVGIGLAVDAVAVPGYLETETSAAGALAVGPDIGIGASITVRTISIDRYGSAGSLLAGVGVLGRLTNAIRVGGTLDRIGIGATADERIRVRFGFALDLRPSATLSIDAAQEQRRGVSLALGISGGVADGITLRGGIGSGPARLGAGIGIVRDRIVIDYGAAWIVPLGFRQTIGAGIRW